MRFCPKCGKKGITSDFCSVCAKDVEKLMIKDIKLKICTDCKRYLYQNKWVSFGDLESLIKKMVKIKLKKNADINPIIPKFSFNPGVELAVDVKVNSQTIKANVFLTLCNNCGKKNTHYFEGILQLRDPNNEIVRFVSNYVENLGNKCFIVRQESVPGGIDLYFTSNKHLRFIGVELLNKFGGILKANSKLVSLDKQTSKNIYRSTVMFRPLAFNIGDVIQANNKLIRVVSLGRAPQGVDLNSNKRLNIDYKKGFEILEKTTTIVSKSHPHVEVIDPETFQSVKVWNHKEVEPGQKVEVVSVNKRIWLVK